MYYEPDMCTDDVPEGMEVESGTFLWNQTYMGKSCLAKADGYSSTNLARSTFQMVNSTMNVSMIKTDDTHGQVMGIELRSQDADDAYKYSWCKQSEKYICVAQVKSLKKVKIELHVCGADGKWHEWYHSDYATFAADTWYKMSFSAVARRVACQILSNSGAVMLETSGNTTADYNTGSAGFGAYGDGWYFGEFNVEEHDDWVEPWETN